MKVLLFYQRYCVILLIICSIYYLVECFCPFLWLPHLRCHLQRKVVMSRSFEVGALVEFCRVGSRVEPVCLTRVKCDTGETHWCNTSCFGAGVIRVYSHWCYTVFYTIIKLVLILVISQEISVSNSNLN